jgi:hypothetical protein
MGLIKRLAAGTSSVTRWALKSGKTITAVKGGKMLTGWKKYGKGIWRAADVAFTGWAIYDFFSSGHAEDELTNTRAQEYIFDQILSDEVKYTLSSDINDTAMIALALTTKGLSLLDDNINGATMRGLTYLSLAQYISDVPVGIRFQEDVIRQVLTSEMVNFIQVTSQDIDTAMAEEVSSSLAAMDMETMPVESLRHLDFLAYFITNIGEMLGLNVSVDSANSVLTRSSVSPSDNGMEGPSRSQKGSSPTGKFIVTSDEKPTKVTYD